MLIMGLLYSQEIDNGDTLIHTNITQTNSSRKIFSNASHHLSLEILMMTAVSADTVYSYLYKTPILGGVYLAYDYQTVSILHHVSLSGGAGRLYSPYISDPDYPSLDDLVFQFSLNYFTAFSIWGYDNHRLYLGFGTHFYGNGWIPDNEEWDILRYTWFLHSGIGIVFNYRWRINPKHSIEIDFYTPVLGVGWRAHYSGYTLKEETLLETEGILSAVFLNPSFLSWHNFFSFDVRFAYQYFFNDVVGIEIVYFGLLEYTKIPRRRFDWQNNISFGVVLSL